MNRYFGEFVGTFALLFADCVAIAANDTYGGIITGAFMNPARSLAPALVSGHLEGLPIYLIVPFLGAALAVFSCRVIRSEDCCVGPDAIDAAHAGQD